MCYDGKAEKQERKTLLLFLSLSTKTNGKRTAA